MQLVLSNHEHATDTYLYLRRGMGVIGLAFPFVLWLGGAVLFDRALQTSMSAYYHTPLRDVFVGVLCTIGVFLFLYKGQTPREDLALNIAGVAAVGIALFPMSPAGDCVADAGGFSPHGVFAVVFFGAIAWVAWFTASDGAAAQLAAGAGRTMRRGVYKLCSAAMAVSIAAAVAYKFLVPQQAEDSLCRHSIVFVIEAVAVIAFSIFWLAKSQEIDWAVGWLPRRLRRQRQPAAAAARTERLV